MTKKNVPVVQEGPTWTDEQVQLIKDTVCQGATDDEFKLFLYACQKTRLDPLMRQIHAVKRWNAQLQRMAMAIQTGIDGYRLIADRPKLDGTPSGYAGQDPPVWTYREDAHPKDAIYDRLEAASVTAYRMIEGNRVGFTGIAFWDEYVQTKKDGNITSFWARMPRGQLAKCAEALALRKAFPQDLAGIYTDDEMAQAGSGDTPPSDQKPPAQDGNGSGDRPPNGVVLAKKGSKEKPTLCAFCGKKHIIKNQPIVKDETGKWGIETCLKKQQAGGSTPPRSQDKKEKPMDPGGEPGPASEAGNGSTNQESDAGQGDPIARGKALVAGKQLKDIVNFTIPGLKAVIAYFEDSLQMDESTLADCRVASVDTVNIDKLKKEKLVIYTQFLAGAVLTDRQSGKGEQTE